MSTSKKCTSSPAAAPPRPARIADRVTAVFGSRPFILIQTVLIIVWIGYNGYVAVRYLHGGVFDPYAFILPYLLFSTQAVDSAPLILLSQTARPCATGSRSSATSTTTSSRHALWPSCSATCGANPPGRSCCGASSPCWASTRE